MFYLKTDESIFNIICLQKLLIGLLIVRRDCNTIMVSYCDLENVVFAFWDLEIHSLTLKE